MVNKKSIIIVKNKGNKNIVKYITGSVWICYDKKEKILMSIGDKKTVEKFFKETKDKYIRGIGTHEIFIERLRNLTMERVPRNQKIINGLIKDEDGLKNYLKNKIKIG